MSRQETLEQFGACWEGLEDPRSGNAALHDFHELPMIALCCVLCGGQGAVVWPCLPRPKSHFCAAFSSWKTACRVTTPSAGCFAISTRISFAMRSSGSWCSFRNSCRAWWPLTARGCARSFDQASGKSALHMVSAWDFGEAAGGHRQSGTEGALPGHGLAALGQLLRHRVSGGDDRGISRRARSRLRIFRLCTDTHSLRLHQDRGHSVQKKEACERKLP